MLVRAELSDLKEIIEVRQEILHPDGPRERVVYEPDEEESTLHLVYKSNDQILAVGTMMFENEDEASSGDLRIRGMAVKAELQGQGVGRQILDEFISFAQEKNVNKIWCNARVRALPLYERKGFVKFGKPFDVPGSGPHYRMRLSL